MRNKRHDNSRGQALVLVTLALFAMVGMMGLAVDLGWSFFIKKTAQAAADAAALGTVREAMSRLGGSTVGFAGCPSTAPSDNKSVYCTGGTSGSGAFSSPVDCSAIASNTDSNLWNGCLYAKNNGFDWAKSGGRQTVTIQAYDTTNPPPTVTGVDTSNIAYWATVRATQTTPQLFSAVLGNTTGTVEARATAAIVAVIVPGSLILLNRSGDCDPTLVSTGFSKGCGNQQNPIAQGQDLVAGGNDRIDAPDGIYMASNCASAGSPAGCGGPAGFLQDQSDLVTAPITLIQGNGQAVYPNGTWVKPPTNGGAIDDPRFEDPTRGTPQPPLATSLPSCGISMGQISASTDPNNPTPLGEYNYYSYDPTQTSHPPNGRPITISGYARFTSDGTGECPGGGTNGSSGVDFPAFQFWGGLNIANGAGVTFGGGEYVLIGASQASNGFTLNAGGGGTGSYTTLNTDTSGNSMGNLFVLATTSYIGANGVSLATQQTTLNIPNLVDGSVNIKAGKTNNFQMSLQGLNTDKTTTLPADLEPYKDVLFWQDRNNSTVPYSDGSGTEPYAPCGDSTNPGGSGCVNGSSVNPEFNLGASPGVVLKGVIYQPRGAWMVFTGSPSQQSALQVITGALGMQGGGNLLLLPDTPPLIRYISALIE